MGQSKHTLSAIAITVVIILISTWAYAGEHWGGKRYGNPGRAYGYRSGLSSEERPERQVEEEDFSRDSRGYGYDYAPGYGKGSMRQPRFGDRRGYGAGSCRR
jgi:hypothetical protein